jgi:hypothetical protein
LTAGVLRRAIKLARTKLSVTMRRTRWFGRVWRPLLALLPAAALLAAAGSASGRVAAPHAAARLYGIPIPPDGDVDDRSLGKLLRSIRADHPGGLRHLVLLIHGFAAQPAAARDEYESIAGLLASHTETAPDVCAVVGVYWESSPGPIYAWVPRAVARRALSPVGISRHVRDPYGTVVWRAHGAGRRGLRRILFALRSDFPGAALHLMTHSLGADLAMNALAPDLTPDEVDGRPAFEPQQELKLDAAFLVGADLDARLFAKGDQAPAARAALRRARLWWFTAPEPGKKDRVLQLREFHVRRRVMGNSGPLFNASDAERLIRERRLVLDMGGVPRSHWFMSYYQAERVGEIAAAMNELAPAPRSEGEEVAGVREELAAGSPPGDAGAGCCLPALDRILAAPPTPAAMAPFLESRWATARIYAAWRLTRERAGEEGMPGGRFSVAAALRAVRAARALVKSQVAASLAGAG